MPFLKWAGGKRQLLPAISKLVPQEFERYYEPFVGAAAVLFGLQPRRARINDANGELMNLYQVIKEEPDALLQTAAKHRNEKEYYYKLRLEDRGHDFRQWSSVERASRILYLNKTCYNGLFRVNSHGQFNVPFGAYAKPRVANAKVIHAVSRYLNEAQIKLSNTDFEEALQDAGQGDFVYLDPPYDPVSDTASFTGYSVGNFGRDQQRRLKKVCDDLTRRGCLWLQSNSATEFIRELYADYEIMEVKASRNINAQVAGRGKVGELLIHNQP